MAKQTFTTGQVLTAAQMTSLQQTAMLGGAASAKTASYTLVAADAGTAISMSNASATTITVNTALFAAGDTVQITNLGAGVCTITAGTATVNTSASLALAQYESGTLKFTSTSAAIFIKGAGAAPASGGMTLISTTAFTGSTVTISSIPNTYKNLLLITKGTYGSTNVDESLRFNADSGNNYAYHNCNVNTTSVSGGGASAQPEIGIGQRTALTGTQELGYSVINIYRYTDTGGVQMTMAKYSATSGSQLLFFTTNAVYYGASAISSISFLGTGGTYSGGNAYLYGVN